MAIFRSHPGRIWPWPRPSQQIDTSVIFQNNWPVKPEEPFYQLRTKLYDKSQCNVYLFLVPGKIYLQTLRLVKGCSDNPCQISWVVSWNEIEWRAVRLGTWEGISNSPWGKKDTKEVLLIHLIRVFVLFSSPVSTSYNLNWTVEDEKESVFGIWKTLSKNLSIIGRRCTRTKLTEWWRQFLLWTIIILLE